LKPTKNLGEGRNSHREFMRTGGGRLEVSRRVKKNLFKKKPGLGSLGGGRKKKALRGKQRKKAALALWEGCPLEIVKWDEKTWGRRGLGGGR